MDSLKDQVIEALKTVSDPEIPVNIWEMGLIYDIAIDPAGAVMIKMTLTAPGCPIAGTLPREVEEKIKALPGITSARAELVWEPPWNKDRMSDIAKLQLGML